ncbi:MAG: CHASE2 domain-containing protein, partial [Elusimicrobiales bacterium]|nr:CHASE2 domain-containing protein [Elusimicrobiales bacterium]
MKKTNKLILVFEIFLSIFIFVSCIFSIYNIGWLPVFENKWSDFIFRKYVEKEPDKRIFIAAIDEKTTSALGYPLKRRYYASMIDNLGKLGVKTIGMDVMFFEPYRDNPLDDRRLISSVKKNRNVVNLFARVETEVGNEIKVPFSDKFSAYSRYIATPNVDQVSDSDGGVRKVKLFVDDAIYSNAIPGGRECLKNRCDGIPMPVLSAALYASYKDMHITDFYLKTKKDILDVDEIQYLNFRKPIDWHLGAEKASRCVYEHISIVDIVRNKLTKEEKEIIKGGIALVG